MSKAIEVELDGDKTQEARKQALGEAYQTAVDIEGMVHAEMIKDNPEAGAFDPTKNPVCVALKELLDA